MTVEIRRLGAEDLAEALSIGHLLDAPVREDATERFLASPTNHLLVAFVNGAPAGFISGVELTHPDKGTEMFLYELGVDEAFRRQGIGRQLTEALAALARERGCYGMWVGTEPDNVAALATYRSAGATSSNPFVVLTWDFDPAEEAIVLPESLG
jgi:ribosomal protein S18 acetylase RimI-like enzyme